ncbi:hypothetical protein BXO88_05000 [Oribacterium sp. C9]|nr:hypothetical protein BXO88_05000 [Oribacterium sp. C9]
MVVETGTAPGMTGYAAESSAETRDSGYDIKAVAKLPEKITVKYGTKLTEINFPETINLLVRTDHSEFNDEESEDTADDTDTASSSSIQRNTEEKATTSEVNIGSDPQDDSAQSSATAGSQDDSAQSSATTGSLDDSAQSSATTGSQDETVASTSELESNASSQTEASNTKATESETSKTSSDNSKSNKDAEFLTEDQKREVEDLLSSRKPKIHEIAKKTGLDLTGYDIKNASISWELDTTFIDTSLGKSDDYYSEVPGKYTFTAHLKSDYDYNLERQLTVEVLPENASNSILYPVHVETRYLTAGDKLNFTITDLDLGDANVYITDKDRSNREKAEVTDGSFFIPVVSEKTDYYILIEAPDDDIKLQMVTQGTSYQNTSGSMEPLKLQSENELVAQNENLFMVQGKNPIIPLTVHWEDAGKDLTAKNSLVGQDIQSLLYLEYFIEGVSTEWKRLDLDEMKTVLGHAAETDHVPSPADPVSETLTKSINNTVVTYSFTDSLYDSVIERDTTSGELISHPVKYRIAAENAVGAHYFSTYEDGSGNEDKDGTILRCYEMQTYTATVKWNDYAKKTNERPSKEDWIKHIHLYKVKKGDTKNAEEINIVTDAENAEGVMSITETTGDEWVINIRGYGYDKNNHPIHYYITQDDINLGDDTGSEGNKITKRHYEASYKNVDNASDQKNSLYTGGTLVNILTGETDFTVYNDWLDDAADTTIGARPTISIKLYRYAKNGKINDKTRWSNLSPIQGSDYEAFKENIGAGENTNKHYGLTLPKEGSLSAYNTDGAELVYVGKVKKAGGSATYKTSLKTKAEKSCELYQNNFALNGETIQNLIEGSVKVTATKTWKAAARQDVKSEVTLSLFKTTKDPKTDKEAAENAAVKLTDTMKLDGFISEVQSRSTTSELPKYDENGDKLYYIAREKSVATAVNSEAANPEFREAVLYKKYGNDYILTYDGYRYIQTYAPDKAADENASSEASDDQYINITNTLVGDAEVLITKTFSSGLTEDDQKNGLEVTFDVYQNKTKIGSVKRIYKDGQILKSDGTVLESNVDFTKEFSNQIHIRSYEDLDEKKDAEKAGLLPRYDDEGVEYRYTAYEHGDIKTHGYSSTVHNSIEEPEKDITISGKTHKEKYLLSNVKIVNSIGEDNHISVYKQWLDDGDSVGREPVTFVLEVNINGTWEQISEATIDPASENYVYVRIPDGYKNEYTAWRNHENGSEHTFRVRETYVGSEKKGKNAVHSYNEAASSIEAAFASQPDVYTAYTKYKDDVASKRSASSEAEQYGFVKGNNYIYDVHVKENDGSVRLDTPQSFDFIITNLRIGYVSFDVNAENWTDGVLKEKARPDSISLEVTKGSETITVPLRETGDAKTNWKAGYGPYRKYDENGKLIDYKLGIKSVSFSYNSNRTEAEKHFAGAYVRTDENSISRGPFHTGDVYSFKLNHELKQNIVPTVNKYWEDDDTKTNKRPDIVMHLYRTYEDEGGNYHVEQLDNTGYIPHEWETNKDEYHNWWQLTYSAQPRFSKGDYYEYTYYITETIPSGETNDYVEIGAFPKSPELNGKTAEYSYDENTPEKLLLENKTTSISAAKVSIDKKDAQTIVNRQRSSRTVSGEKIYSNLPAGYSSSNLTKIKFELWRKIGNEVTEPVYEYVHDVDTLGRDILKLKEGGKKLTTIYDPATAKGSTKFQFRNEDGTIAEVPKYDEKGRLYTYTIREVSDGADSEESKLIGHVFNLKTEDTLTNGLVATNGYNVNDGYEITFYKKWDGLELYSKSHDTATVPSIKVRLYRYLQSKDGIIAGSEELVTTTDVILKYDSEHPEYSSYTWQVPYYAPNLKPYFYVVSENPGEEVKSYGEVYTAEIKDRSGEVNLDRSGKNLYGISTEIANIFSSKTGGMVNHNNNWTGYDTPVNGEYSIDDKKGKGTAGFINVYTGDSKAKESTSSSKGSMSGNTPPFSSQIPGKTEVKPETAVPSTSGTKPQTDTKTGTTTTTVSSSGSGSGSSVSRKSTPSYSRDNSDNDSDDRPVTVTNADPAEKGLKYSEDAKETSIIQFYTDTDSASESTFDESGSVLVAKRPFDDDSTSAISRGRSGAPKTGDESAMFLYGILSLVSMLISVSWFVINRKKRTK